MFHLSLDFIDVVFLDPKVRRGKRRNLNMVRSRSTRKRNIRKSITLQMIQMQERHEIITNDCLLRSCLPLKPLSFSFREGTLVLDIFWALIYF